MGQQILKKEGDFSKMNVTRTADELYELEKQCNWELITDIGQMALINIRSEIDMLSFLLSKEGMNDSSIDGI